MAGTHPVLLAALAGFVCALIFASIPVGPINLTILNEGAQRGFVWAVFIGLGAATMDTIYCAISFTGLSQFFDHGLVKAFMQVMGFVFLLFLGFKFLLAQTVKVPTKLDSASEKLGARIESKIHPHSAFATGFCLRGFQRHDDLVFDFKFRRLARSREIRRANLAPPATYFRAVLDCDRAV